MRELALGAVAALLFVAGYASAPQLIHSVILGVECGEGEMRFAIATEEDLLPECEEVQAHEIAH